MGAPFNTILYNGAGGGGLGSLSVGNVIIYRALRLGQVLKGPGQSASPEKLNDGLIALNGLLDYLSAQRAAIYTVRNDRYTMTQAKPVYTIGIDPTGVQTADFPAIRPVRIERANIVLTSSPSEVYIYCRILTDKEWETISLRKFGISIPQFLYCDYDNPISKLYLRGYPTEANDLELWTWQQLAQYQTIDDQVTLPPAYLDCLVYNLAVRMSDMFGTELRANVLMEARRTLGRVKALNSPSPAIGSADFGNRRGGGFNYFTGGPA